MSTSAAPDQRRGGVEFVEEIPMTATGKFSKRTLRERFVGDLVGDRDSDER